MYDFTQPTVYPVSIGIDPGKNTGFAVYSIPQGKLIECASYDLWDVHDRIGDMSPGEVAVIVIELPSSRHVWHSPAANIKAAQRQGMHIGFAIREAELLVQRFIDWGFNVKTVNPAGKVDAKKFSAYTGWTGRTNQHARDAALMCYKRTK